MVGGCATVDGTVAGHANAALRTRLTFVDSRFQPIPDEILDNPEKKWESYPEADFPDPIILHFFYVAGRTAGPIATRSFDRLWLKRKHAALEPNSQRDFAINLDFLERKLGEVATPYVRRPEDIAMAARPEGTRLAALLLGVTDTISFEYYGAGAMPMFYDWGAGDPLMMIYVDRPCEISGTIDTSQVDRFVEKVPELSKRLGGVWQLDIMLAKAGLHWVSLRPTENGKISVRNVDPVGPIGVIVLENVMALRESRSR